MREREEERERERKKEREVGREGGGEMLLSDFSPHDFNDQVLASLVSVRLLGLQIKQS